MSATSNPVREELLLHRAQVAEDEMKSLRSKLMKLESGGNRGGDASGTELELLKRKYLELYEETQTRLKEKQEVISKYEEEIKHLKAQSTSTQLEDEMLMVLKKAEQVSNLSFKLEGKLKLIVW